MKSERVSLKRFSKRGLGVMVAGAAIAALAPAGAQAAGLTVPQASQAAPVVVPHAEPQVSTPAPAPAPAPAPTPSSEPAAASNGACEECLGGGGAQGNEAPEPGGSGAGPSRSCEEGIGCGITPSGDRSDGGSLIAALFGLPLQVSAQAMGVTAVTWATEAQMLERGIMMSPGPAPIEPETLFPPDSSSKYEPSPYIPPPAVVDGHGCPNGTFERVNGEIEDGGGANGCY